MRHASPPELPRTSTMSASTLAAASCESTEWIANCHPTSDRSASTPAACHSSTRGTQATVRRETQMSQREERDLRLNEGSQRQHPRPFPRLGVDGNEAGRRRHIIRQLIQPPGHGARPRHGAPRGRWQRDGHRRRHQAPGSQGFVCAGGGAVDALAHARCCLGGLGCCAAPDD